MLPMSTFAYPFKFMYSVLTSLSLIKQINLKCHSRIVLRTKLHHSCQVYIVYAGEYKVRSIPPEVPLRSGQRSSTHVAHWTRGHTAH